MTKLAAIIVLAASPCWATNPCSVTSSRVVTRINKSLPVNAYNTTYSDFQTTSAYSPIQYVYTVGMSVREQSYRTKLSQAEQKAAQAQGIVEGMERAMRLMQGRGNSLEPTPASRSIVSQKCGSCHSGDDAKAGIVYDDGPYTWEEAGQAIQQIMNDAMPRATAEQKANGVDPKLSREEKNQFLKYIYDHIGE